MSGGAYNYLCYRIEEDLVGHMKDDEMNEFVQDFANLAHDLEWCDSGDTSEKDYFESLAKFKEIWNIRKTNIDCSLCCSSDCDCDNCYYGQIEDKILDTHCLNCNFANHEVPTGWKPLGDIYCRKCGRKLNNGDNL